MLGDRGDKNRSQICPGPREAQEIIGERDTEEDKGIEGQLAIILDQLVSQHRRESLWVKAYMCCFYFLSAFTCYFQSYCEHSELLLVSSTEFKKSVLIPSTHWKRLSLWLLPWVPHTPKDIISL